MPNQDEPLRKIADALAINIALGQGDVETLKEIAETVRKAGVQIGYPSVPENDSIGDQHLRELASLCVHRSDTPSAIADQAHKARAWLKERPAPFENILERTFWERAYFDALGRHDRAAEAEAAADKALKARRKYTQAAGA